MRPIPLAPPLPATTNWGTVWAAVSAIAASAGLLGTAVAVIFTWCGLRNARKQDLASRVDALLTMLGTGEIARARSDIYALAHSHSSGGTGENPPPLRQLCGPHRDQVFALLWALQRMSVLTPVISTSGESSIRVLSEQITQIVDTLTTLGEHLSWDERKSMCDAVISTEKSLSALENQLITIGARPGSSWSDQLHSMLCTRYRMGEAPKGKSGQVEADDGVVEQRP